MDSDFGQDIRERGSHKSTLVMLSGGIDSVYVLAKLLQETDDIVLVHHIHMVNDEGRFKVEAEQCKNIVQWCRQNYREFGYSESAIDHRGLFAMGFDIVAVGFEAGVVSKSFKAKYGIPLDRWMTGWCLEEKTMPGRTSHVRNICAASSYPTDPPDFYYFPPISKASQMRYLSKELLDLCWTCRWPVWNKDGTFDECGKCLTCDLMGEVRQELAAPE